MYVNQPLFTIIAWLTFGHLPPTTKQMVVYLFAWGKAYKRDQEGKDEAVLT